MMGLQVEGQNGGGRVEARNGRGRVEGRNGMVGRWKGEMGWWAADREKNGEGRVEEELQEGQRGGGERERGATLEE